MPFWLAFPIYTLAFAAPIGFAIMLFWPLWHPSTSILIEASELIAVVLLTLGFSGVAAMVALRQKHSPRTRQ